MNKQRFDILRKEKQMTLEQLSEQTGIPVSTLTKISAGYTNTSFSNMCKIALVLHCSLDEFMEEETGIPLITSEDRELLSKYHQLSSLGQDIAKSLLDRSLAHQKNHTGLAHYNEFLTKSSFYLS